MTDPRFPNRPDHPDFWLISEAVQDFDSAADDGTKIERLIASMVDPKSLMYVAEQRAARALGASPANPLFRQTEESIKVQAAWLDAFVAGALYQKYKMEREGNGGAPKGHLGPPI